jgi:type IV pilus assembly protein PilO
MNSLLQKLEGLEPKQRWIFVGLLLALFGGGFYYVHSGNAERIDTLTTEVQELQQSVDKYTAIAVRYDELKARVAELDAVLKVALTLLPETREIPELLIQISRLGESAGLEFRLFKPEGEKPHDFYAEVPVNLSVVGPYHRVAVFFDQLSRLPRIVNVTGIKMSRSKGSEADLTLTTNCLLTTFRFLEPGEADGKKAAKPDGEKKGS